MESRSQPNQSTQQSRGLRSARSRFPAAWLHCWGLGAGRDTEAAIVLARLAVLHPAGVICEILNEDGQGCLTWRGSAAGTQELKVVAVADLASYRLECENERSCRGVAVLETPLLSTLWLSTEGLPGLFLLRRKRLHSNYGPSCGSGNSGTIIPAVTGRNRALESLLARWSLAFMDDLERIPVRVKYIGGVVSRIVFHSCPR